MKSRTLYIIGNGFDLHHRIPSSYAEFGAWLQEADRATYEEVERYFTVDEMFWAEFEDRLASFDSDTLAEQAADFLVGYGAPDWSDAYHHDYQFEIDRVVKAISRTLRDRFADWIRQLVVPAPHQMADRLVRIDPTATFLNFNYTDTLQRLYGVPDARILYIHGDARSRAPLVLGHGWEPEPNLDPYRISANPEDADIREVEGQSLIDAYFAATFKPSKRIITEQANFFRGLGSVERVLVMGHSISTVDHPYFAEVLRQVPPQASWKVSYYGDWTPLQKRMKPLGVVADRAEFMLLSEF